MTQADTAEDLAALHSKLHEAQAEAKSLRVQLDYARAELIEAREELKWMTPSRIETRV